MARLQRAYSISMVTETGEDIRIVQVQGQKKEDLSVALQKGHKSCLFYDDTPQICCSSFLSCNQLTLVTLGDFLFVLNLRPSYSSQHNLRHDVVKKCLANTYLSALVFEI